MHDAEKPNFQTSISNVINNRHDFRNYLLATGNIGKSIQENLNLVVTDGRLNDAIIRHALDTKHKHILADPNPPQITFKDIKKFDAQNPIIGKLLNQIGACNLSDKKIKEQLGQLKDRELETLSSILTQVAISVIIVTTIIFVGGQLDYHLRHLPQELQMNPSIHLLA